MTTTLLALLLVPMALALVAGLLTLLARPLVGPVANVVEGMRVRRFLQRAARADALLAARRTDAALREIEAAFCLLTIHRDATLLDVVNQHHTGLLSRLLSIADDSPSPRVRLLALAKVDRLLERRHQLLVAFRQLQSRPRGDARRAQLHRQLRDNASATRAAIHELVSDVQLLGARRVAVQ